MTINRSWIGAWRETHVVMQLPTLAWNFAGAAAYASLYCESFLNTASAINDWTSFLLWPTGPSSDEGGAPPKFLSLKRILRFEGWLSSQSTRISVRVLASQLIFFNWGLSTGTFSVAMMACWLDLARVFPLLPPQVDLVVDAQPEPEFPGGLLAPPWWGCSLEEAMGRVEMVRSRAERQMLGRRGDITFQTPPWWCGVANSDSRTVPERFQRHSEYH